MSKRRGQKRHDGSTRPPASRRSTSAAWALALVAGVAAPALWYWQSNQVSLAPAATESARAQATAPAAAAARPRPHLQTLTGRWRRADGGYILEINSVTDTGAMDASYFNPRPIHVAKAVASLNGEIIEAFVELRDVNYPGSTYTLVYEPASDQLTGIYYQAVQQQRFDVVFTRSLGSKPDVSGTP